MAEGRIGATIDELRRRLESVRESVRASPPTRTEILSDGPEPERAEPAPVESVEPIRIDAEAKLGAKARDSSEPSPVLGWQDEDWEPFERRILDVLLDAFPEAITARELASRLQSTYVAPEKCEKSEVNSQLYLRLSDWLDQEGDAPPYWALRTADAEEETDSSAPRDAPPGEHRDSGVSESGSQEPYLGSCSRCGGDVGLATIVGDEGLICGECARVIRARPSPDRGWKEENWDSLSRRILNELDDAFPESLTAGELVRRLRRSGSKPDIDVSEVKKTLYARLWNWVERDGEVSPEWSVREAEDTGEALSGQPTDPAPDGSEGPRDDEDREMLEEESGARRGTTDPSPGTDYALCAMCMTESQESSLTRFRGRRVCPSCMDDLLG